MNDAIGTPPSNDAEARAALGLDGADGGLARVLEFDPTALVREADARRAALSPDERRERALAAARNRRLAARALIGERAPEWLEELVSSRGHAFLDKNPVLKIATRVAFGEERADAIATLTRHLVDHGVGHLVALALVGAWATYYAGPVPHESEILDVVARVVEERKAARSQR